MKGSIHNILGSLFCLFLASVSYGQYCTSVGPSSINDSNLQSLVLNGESGTAINFTGCPGVIGLDNQTANQSVNLLPGLSYSSSLNFGTCGGSYAGSGEVWIDYNQNQIFELSEKIGSWQGTPPVATVFNFTVPIGAVLGNTRLRVVHQEAGTPPLDPCASYTWGSTIDFTVFIGTPFDCSGYIGDNMQDPRIVSSLPFQEDHSNAICYTNNVPVYSSPDVFYRLIPADYDVEYINISLCGSGFDTYLQVHKDTIGNVIASNDDYDFCAPQSELTFYAGNLDTVYVVVQGWSFENGDYSIAINDGSLASLTVEQHEISIYPNPASTSIQISGLETESVIAITNTEGRQVYRNLHFNQDLIDLSEFETGVYFLKIEQNGKSSVHKLILGL